MRSADSNKLRRTKTNVFNDPISDVLMFVVMAKVGVHGLNLYKACSFMIQCDIAIHANQVLQMKGPIDRLGQKEPARVEIIALEYSFDIQRQANLANKMIPAPLLQ